MNKYIEEFRKSCKKLEEINNLVKKYANILQKENKNKTLEPGLLKSLNLR